MRRASKSPPLAFDRARVVETQASNRQDITAICGMTTWLHMTYLLSHGEGSSLHGRQKGGHGAFRDGARTMLHHILERMPKAEEMKGVWEATLDRANHRGISVG